MIRRLAVVLLLAGCAAPPHARYPSLELPNSRQERDYQELRRLDNDFRAADVQAAATPDCARVAQLRDNICALAARICKITEQEATDATTWRCLDGNARCANATERARARGCPKK